MARRRHDLRLIVLCGILIGVLWLTRFERPDTVPGSLEPGQLAPDFSLPIVAGPGWREGDRLALRDLRGNPVLLEFWASWCVPCVRSLPRVVAQVAQARDRGLLLVGVNCESGRPEQVRSALREMGAAMPSVQDPESRAQVAYGIEGLPTSVLIGADGRVRAVQRGAVEPDTLSAWLDNLPVLGDLDDPGHDR